MYLFEEIIKECTELHADVNFVFFSELLVSNQNIRNLFQKFSLPSDRGTAPAKYLTMANSDEGNIYKDLLGMIEQRQWGPEHLFECHLFESIPTLLTSKHKRQGLACTTSTSNYGVYWCPCVT